MKFTFHVGGIPFNGETIKKQSMGGSETAAYYLTKELAKRHEIILYTNSQEEGIWNGVEYRWAGESTQDNPHGRIFHKRAIAEPTDVMVIQRHVRAFHFEWNSRVNLWWTHDLLLRSQFTATISQMWNIDAICPVSQWHGEQFRTITDLAPDYVRPLYNAIDPKLFTKKITTPLALKFQNQPNRKLLYVSRPERNLDQLVNPDGVMAKLLKIDPTIHLYVCGYKNNLIPPEFVNYYNDLWVKIAGLPNCTNLGELKKSELADIMRTVDAWAYPSLFEETSCISAMEFMAAGTNIIASTRGAIPETTKGYSGVTLIPIKKNGRVNIDRHVKEILKLDGSRPEPMFPFTWDQSAKMVEDTVEHVLSVKTRNAGTVANHLMHYSDIYALKKMYDDDPKLKDSSEMLKRIHTEMNHCYSFAFDNNFRAHYNNYYEWMKGNEGVFGPEDISQHSRFLEVAKLIEGVKAGGIVLDYGCAHGHYCMNLAKLHPDKTFIGIDFVEENQRVFQKWAKDDAVYNVTFILADAADDLETIYKKTILRKPVDCIMVNEVLEHVPDPGALVDSLTPYLKASGFIIGTTPAGPWEFNSYHTNPWRCHVVHLEENDLKDIFGHHPDFALHYMHMGKNRFGEHIGHNITSFKKPKKPSRKINYKRKMKMLSPRETLSCCMIVKNGEQTLRRCLDSAADVINELIIGVDETTTDRTVQIIKDFATDRNWINVRYFPIKSPMEVGFAAARNKTIKDVSCDWIMWLDADEVLTHPEVLNRYLRNNQFNAYSIEQHHFSLHDPLGLLKTDKPTKIFRSNRGIKFYGLIHEHPELGMNMTTGRSITLNHVTVAHQGYWDENMRVDKFRNRNLELLVRDREENPERILGKYLWLRDLCQMCTNELKANGGVITDEMKKRAEIGIDTWEELLDLHQVQMAVDGLPFYSTLVRLSGGGIEYGMVSDAQEHSGLNLAAQKPLIGTFKSIEHIEKLLKETFHEQTKGFGTRYS